MNVLVLVSGRVLATIPLHCPATNSVLRIFDSPTWTITNLLSKLCSEKKSGALLRKENVPHKAADFKSSKKRIRFHGPADFLQNQKMDSSINVGKPVG